MGELAAAVDRFFASDGPLVSGAGSFRYRSGQHAMALEVAAAIEGNSKLVVEAGTGIGKTFAYLAPILLGRGRAIVSTATKALQDQLLMEDLPRLQTLLPSPVKSVALKGRASYVCLHRLEVAIQDPMVVRAASASVLQRLNAWSRVTEVGDMAEFLELDEGSLLLPSVTSTRENCLGATCPHVARCHVNRARKEAMSADLVVVNHHLFFADFQIRESGVAELLPAAAIVVFDEAHQLNDIGVQFLGQQLSSAQLDSFFREVSRLTDQHAPGWAPWAEQLDQCEMQVAILRELSGGLKVRALWGNHAPTGISEALWADCLRKLSDFFAALFDALQVLADASPELRILVQRAGRLKALLDLFTGPPQAGFLRWLEPGTTLRMMSSPIDIAQCMHEKFFGPEVSGAPMTWIFTSATLGADAGLSWFTDSVGLSGAREVQLPSPFDYAKQSTLYIPAEFPAPGEPVHSAHVADLVAQSAALLGGRTLVLATTLRAMRAIAASLAHSLSSTRIQVLVQGQASKMALLEQFKQAGRSEAHPVVLVASVSFWEGIDIPGEALQLLVIDKLPFAPPDDPVQMARAARIEGRGGNAFKELHLTQAAIALRQGAGRLIRSENDRGVLVVCDRRLLSASYGKKLVASLPPMRRIHTRDALLQALTELTRTSTRDCPESSRHW